MDCTALFNDSTKWMHHYDLKQIPQTSVYNVYLALGDLNFCHNPG